jgi:hypothetical protein
MLNLFIGNDNILEVYGLTNSETGVVDVAANVTVVLRDGAGVAVLGQPWPTTLNHVANGVYRATLEDTLDLARGRTYYGDISAIGTGGEVAAWEAQIKAQPRKAF